VATLTTEIAAERLRMYQVGYTDRQIAKVEAVRPSVICKWRLKNGLETKCPKYGRPSRAREQALEEFEREIEDAVMAWELQTGDE